ncbi:unnamed protein product, partial [Effrenium voratum]
KDGVTQALLRSNQEPVQARQESEDDRTAKKRSNAQKKVQGQAPLSKMPAFNSGGVTWVGIPVSSASWLERDGQGQQQNMPNMPYGWLNTELDMHGTGPC